MLYNGTTNGDYKVMDAFSRNDLRTYGSYKIQ